MSIVFHNDPFSPFDREPSLRETPGSGSGFRRSVAIPNAYLPTAVDAARLRVGARPLGAHFHNTRGAGLASAWAAVSAGVSRLDSSVGGLGGCPFAPGASGNIATEDLVYLLRDSGIGVDLDLATTIEAARVAREVVGHDLPSALLRAGDRLR